MIHRLLHAGKAEVVSGGGQEVDWKYKARRGRGWRIGRGLGRKEGEMNDEETVREDKEKKER